MPRALISTLTTRNGARERKKVSLSNIGSWKTAILIRRGKKTRRLQASDMEKAQHQNAVSETLEERGKSIAFRLPCHRNHLQIQFFVKQQKRQRKNGGGDQTQANDRQTKKN